MTGSLLTVTGETVAELHHLLVELNDTDVAYPPAVCISELFEAQAARTPDLVAVIFEHEHLTYGELNRQSNQLARYLRRLGVGPETLVALFMERSLELVVAILAIMKAGAAYVPLETSYPAERLAFLLNDTGAPVVLTQRHLHEKLPGGEGRTLLCLDSDQTRFTQESTENFPSGALPDNLAYALFTSGSTGLPKGVLMSHQALYNRLCWMREALQFTEADRMLHKTALVFDASVCEILLPLVTGARLIVAKPGAHADAAYLVNVVAQHGITYLDFAPTLLRIFLEEPSVEVCSRSVRTIFCGGEPLPLDLHNRLFELLRTTLYNDYGPTETCLAVTTLVSRGDTTGWSDRTAVPIGRPIANVQIYLLDQDMNPVPFGAEGEVYIGGAQLARGYLNRPDLTAARFVPNPFSSVPGTRLYRTGDLARYLPDGNLEFVGRADRQVKLRGFRIELGEIEAALCAHPAVRDAVVVLREEASRQTTPGYARLVAYVIPARDTTVTTSELYHFLKAKLPDHMVPAAFVPVNAFPLTAGGKIDRSALPAPDDFARRLVDRYIAPRTAVEETLATIWTSMLRVDRVGIHDNFFELGGDSILAIQIVARAGAAGIKITSQQMFQHPTIAQLAAVASEAVPSRAEQGIVTGAVPLTPIQHWLFSLDLPEPHHWNQPMWMELREPLKVPVLERALQQLVTHHDALRMRFVHDGKSWHQSNAGLGETVSCEVIDLASLAEGEREPAMARAITRLQGSLNLEHGPLLRAGLFEFGGDRPQRLLLVVHHLVVDSVSWGVLLEDLQTAYRQIERGQEPRLPEKTTSFQRWAALTVEYAQSDMLLAEVPYWLSEARASVARLPVDLIGGENTESSLGSVLVSLSEENTRALLQDVPPIYHTRINDVLLTALVCAFERWTGERRLLVDLEGHGREDIVEGVDLSRTVGWFTTAFPVLLDLGQSQGPGEALKAIKEQIHTIPRKGIGYGLLRYLSGNAGLMNRLRAMPQSEVVFNYLGQFDHTISETSLLGLAHELSESARGPRNKRGQLIEINGYVMEGRLQFVWEYSRNIHHTATIQRVADEFVNALESIIVHCRQPGVGGYTASDFPLAKLDQRQLDRLLGSARGVEDMYPLSPMQEGMLFHSLHAPQSGMYVGHFSFVMEGEVNVLAFTKAWQYLLDRHPALRTRFAWEGLASPLQIVAEHVPVPLEQRDWRHLAPEEQRDRLVAFVQSDRERGYDLAAAPLLRLFLLRLQDDVYYFLWSMHHAIMDGWSMPLVFDELWVIYEALRVGEEPRLGPSRPYRDYIAWLQAQDPAQSEAFWRDLLRGFSVPTTVGMERPRAAADQPASFAERKIILPAATYQAAQAFAREQQITLNTLLQGAWALLLSQYSDTQDVVFGTVVAGRPASLPGVESIVGLFINTLPARISVTPATNLLAWLKEIQRRQIEMREYEHTPLPQIQQWSDVPAGVPLFESILVLENYAPENATNNLSDAIVVRDVANFDQTNYPLTVVAMPGRELSLLMSYNTRYFTAPMVERMLEHLGTVLEAMLAQPKQPLSSYALVSDAERSRILQTWNNTVFGYDPGVDVPERIAAWAERTPHALAVAAGDDSLTFGELNSRAEALANRLRRLGVGHETRVGICVERSAAMVVGLLGILKAGAAYVPMDPTYPHERLNFILDDAGAAILLTQRHLLARVPQRPIMVCLDGDEDDLLCESAIRMASPASPLSLAYVIYTSGSTGQPKGVEVSRGALINRVAWYAAAYGVTPADRGSQFFSVAFDVCGWELWPHLAAGASVHIVDDAIRSSPWELQRWILDRRITICNLPTTLAEAMLDLDWPTDAALRYIQTGGEKLQRRPKPGLPFRLINNYGPTENTVTSTWYSVLSSAETDEPIAIGTPLGNTQAYLIDRYGQLAPVGVPGELVLGGDSLARGYLNRPDLTAERFIPNPFGTEPGARLYRTGDLARYRPDGTLEFLGRLDHQIKIRGYRVELGEIEALLDTHPHVRESVVMLREDTPGVPRLVGYVIARDEPIPDGHELRAFLVDRLPAYMVPDTFVVLDSLPLNSSGKVDHKRLPVPPRDDRNDAFVRPRTPLEAVVAKVWAMVLGLNEVGIEDNFFALGGHSLLATRVMSQIHDIFQVNVPMRVLFDAPTVAALAEALLSNESIPGQVANIAQRWCETGNLAGAQTLADLPGRDAHLIPPRPLVDRAPLSFAQQRLWFLDQLEPGGTLYLIPDVFRLHGRLDVSVLERSVQALVDRHESLRTTFTAVDGKPLQVIAPTLHLDIPKVDLRALPAQEREERLLALAREEASRPFDLAQGPLIRITLLQLAEQEHALFLTMHHIITDGWSMDIFIRELVAVYTAFVKGEVSLPWAPPALHYGDFAAWQQGWLQGDVLEAEVTYWKRQLAGAPFVLDLPTDRPRPSLQSYRGGVVTLTLPDELSASLKSLSRAEGATLFMTLFAAFVALLSRYTGQTDILVGTTIANRNRSELEHIIGFFVNTLVLRADLSGNPTFSTLIGRVREMCLDAYAHQDLPFEKLVEELQPERDLSRTPLFQVMFALQNAPMDGWDLPGMTVQPLELPDSGTPFDLDVEFRESANGLTGTFVYNTDIFEHATIMRMAGHFERLLESLLADSDQRVAEVGLLTVVEQQALAQWNATTAPYPTDRCVHQLFEEQAARTPEAIAVMAGDTQLTYRELDEQSNRLAAYLRNLGVGPDVVVGLCVDRSPQMIVAMLGILKSGGAYVPLDPSYPQERLAFMVEDSQTPVILTQQRYRTLFTRAAATVVCLDADSPFTAQAQPGSSCIQQQPSPDSLAYVIYTSGSTGQPKGVMIQHQSLVCYTRTVERQWQLGPGDRVVQFISMSFDMSVEEIFPCLTLGATLVLRTEQMIDSVAGFLRACADQGVTVLVLPTAYWHEVTNALASEALALPPSLRLVYFGGDKALPERVRSWLKHASPNVRLINSYGPTEATVTVTMHDLAGPMGGTSAWREVPIGVPLQNVQLYVLDASGQPTPIGVPGELHIGGVMLARGYLNRPALTAERFVPDPFGTTPGGRLYRTGDLVRYLPDGNLEFLGRIDNQVKIRGFRIELGDVEAALAKHPAVRDVVVVAREAMPGERRLVAYLVAEPDAMTATEARHFLSASLPDYMIPSSFMLLPSLPMTPNGKIDRHRLPTPDAGLLASQATYLPPGTPTEQSLASIWASVLGVERVGRQDSFFDLGGHSLLASQVLSRIRELFQVELPLRRIFEMPTLAELAATIDSHGASTRSQMPALTRRSREAYRVTQTSNGTVRAPKPNAIKGKENVAL